MTALFDPLKLGELTLKNRITVPPMVIYNRSDDSGLVTESQVAHYREIAQGGPGLIIQEASAVEKDGRLCNSQIGIWDDEQIEGLKKITAAVHQYEVPIIVQIHHAGVFGFMEETVSPSHIECVVKGEKKEGRELSIHELHRIQRSFISAAKRAYIAGYDGVELHGCHNYLISQFLNNRVNKREDEYGKRPELFALEIIREIRKCTPSSFIVGIRLGAFEPTLSDSISHAITFDKNKVDFLDISYGFDQRSEPEMPEDYPFTDRIYAAQEIKRQVSIPVFVVGDITSPEKALDILTRAGVDMADIGRGILVNPNWTNDAKEGGDTGTCFHCKICMWRVDPAKCPGRIQYRKKVKL